MCSVGTGQLCVQEGIGFLLVLGAGLRIFPKDFPSVASFVCSVTTHTSCSQQEAVGRAVTKPQFLEMMWT